jgi:excisionase family DNA binding protein
MSTAITIDAAAFYTTYSAAELLDLSTETLKKAIKSGELKATKRGRFWFIRGSELLNWLGS